MNKDNFGIFFQNKLVNFMHNNLMINIFLRITDI